MGCEALMTVITVVQIFCNFYESRRFDGEEKGMKTNSASAEPSASFESDLHWENDAVWALLRKSPHQAASAEFSAEVMMAVRQADETWRDSPWTSNVMRVAIGMAAVLVVAVSWWLQKPQDISGGSGAEVVVVDEFAPLEEVVTQEVLLAAADQLHDFSDTELVTLIGF